MIYLRGVTGGDELETSTDFWRKCSTCKKAISWGQQHYICSVSTCNGQRTGYVFCSILCWDAHVPGAKHRDAGALERVAPKREPVRKIVTAPLTGVRPPATSKVSAPREILVVASKLKDYIRITAEMNTSASVMDILSEFLRRECDEAVIRARSDGRKTVMDKDFER